MALKNRKGMTLTEITMTGVMVGALALSFSVLGLTIYGLYHGARAAKKYVNEPVIERANVIGDEKPELFIDRGGKKFYTEIDGMPIESYLKK